MFIIIILLYFKCKLIEFLYLKVNSGTICDIQKCIHRKQFYFVKTLLAFPLMEEIKYFYAQLLKIFLNFCKHKIYNYRNYN